MSMHQDTWTSRLASPEAVAIRAVGFLTGRGEELERFLTDSGLTREELTRPLSSAQLQATLDFLIAHEETLLEFAQAIDLPPEAAYEARRLFRQVTSQEHGWPPYLSRTPGRPVPSVPV